MEIALTSARPTPWTDQEVADYCLQRVYRYLSSRIADREACEDLTMEVYLAYLKGRRKAHLAKSIPAWLIGIAHHKLVDFLKRRPKVEAFLPDQIAPNAGPQEDRLVLYQAIAQLSDREREVIVLKYVVEFSTAEIAALFGDSEIAIQSLLQRSRAKLAALTLWEEQP